MKKQIGYILRVSDSRISVNTPPREAHDRVARYAHAGDFVPGDEIELIRRTEEVVGTYTVLSDGTVAYKAKS